LNSTNVLPPNRAVIDTSCGRPRTLSKRTVGPADTPSASVTAIEMAGNRRRVSTTETVSRTPSPSDVASMSMRLKTPSRSRRWMLRAISSSWKVSPTRTSSCSRTTSSRMFWRPSMTMARMVASLNWARVWPCACDRRVPVSQIERAVVKINCARRRTRCRFSGRATCMHRAVCRRRATRVRSPGEVAAGQQIERRGKSRESGHKHARIPAAPEDKRVNTPDVWGLSLARAPRHDRRARHFVASLI
jgi:hypothetical protein